MVNILDQNIHGQRSPLPLTGQRLPDRNLCFTFLLKTAGLIRKRFQACSSSQITSRFRLRWPCAARARSRSKSGAGKSFKVSVGMIIQEVWLEDNEIG